MPLTHKSVQSKRENNKNNPIGNHIKKNKTSRNKCHTEVKDLYSKNF